MSQKPHSTAFQTATAASKSCRDNGRMDIGADCGFSLLSKEKFHNFGVLYHSVMRKIVINGVGDLDRAAQEFLRLTYGVRIYAFYGSMGAGKTTFISALCRVLGVGDEVSSPTFTIVNEYRSGDGRAVYHFDFYRIEKLQEVLDIGYGEYMDSDGICLMEWPEKIEAILPEDTLRVHIAELPDGSRSVTF